MPEPAYRQPAQGSAKETNDRIFWHAFDLSQGISHVARRGIKARLRFAHETAKLHPSYGEMKEAVNG